MAGGQERVLRRRIRSVQATQKLTRAMELIAASQIVRSQSRITAAAPYQAGIADVLAESAHDAGDIAGKLLGVPESPERILVLALVADRGLAGGYSVNVLRMVERLLRASEPGRSTQIVAVGRKAQSYFRFRRIAVETAFVGFTERPTFEDARRIAAFVTPQFQRGEVDQVLIVSTRFLSAGRQVVETRQILPLPEPSGEETADVHDATGGAALSAASAAGQGTAQGAGSGSDGFAEFEPSSEEVLQQLVPRYTEAAVFGALLEAAASEHTARQRAMAAATDNAEELVKTLTRVMNRARQDAITTEIMEIVGGAEALRQAAEAEEI
ncbi:MAG TPA: ATP synthase F1 subunit gamma [Acidimicrobiales bacterium]|nr:ATP synthase F1 subunit gamma [Acidimicrobiales bacterium]